MNLTFLLSCGVVAVWALHLRIAIVRPTALSDFRAKFRQRVLEGLAIYLFVGTALALASTADLFPPALRFEAHRAVVLIALFSAFAAIPPLSLWFFGLLTRILDSLTDGKQGRR